MTNSGPSHRGRSRVLALHSLVWLALAFVGTVLCVASLLPEGGYTSSGVGRPGSVASQTIRALPADFHLLIAAQDPAGQLATPQGATMARMLLRTGLLSDGTAVAWKKLAESMRVDSDEAFEMLLGSKLVLAARIEGARLERTSWVVISELDRSTSRKLFSTLRLSAREEIRGAPVFAGERGGFRLAVVGSKRSSQSLVLSLDQAADIFEQTVRALASPEDQPGRLGATAVGGALDRHETSQVVVLYRAYDVQRRVSPEAGWERYTAFGAAQHDAGWTAQLEMGLPSDEPPPLAAWPAGAVEQVDDGQAALALVTTAGPLQLEQTRSLIAAEHWDPFARPFADLVTGRVAASLRVPKDEGGSGSGSVSVAIESNAPLAFAAAMDSFLARLLTSLREAAGLEDPVVDFQGEIPEAIRVQPLEGAGGATLTRLVGTEPTASWALCERPALKPEDGWWALGLSGPAEEWPVTPICEQVHAAHVLGGAPERLSEGIVRPARLEQWVAAIEPRTARTLLMPFDRVEEVRWALWPATNPVRLVGAVEVRVIPDEAPE